MDQREILSKVRLDGPGSERVSVCLLLLLCLGIAAKAAMALIEIRSVAGSVTESMAFLQAQNDKAAEYLDAYSKDTEKLKEKGIFCVPKKEPSPPQVTGILGDSVLMSNKWCKVGDEHAGAKVLKIEPTEITILWKEKEMKLAPMLASVPDDSAPAPNKKNKKKETPVGKAEETVEAAPVAEAVAEDDPLAWLGMEVSAELRSFLLKLFDAMPSEQVEAAKQEWAGMSDDQKQQRIAEAQAMVDSGQADAMLQQMNAN